MFSPFSLLSNRPFASLRHNLPDQFLTEEIKPVAPDAVGGSVIRQRAARLVHPAVRVEVRVADGFVESYASLECVKRVVRTGVISC